MGYRVGVAMDDVVALLRALEYAADRHRDQRRKDAGQTPYVNHLISVASLIAGVGGVGDPTVLQAAVLHDSVEDVGVTGAELAERFGADIAGLVAEVTDNTSLPREERKRLQVERAHRLSPRAKVIKLADKIANVTDIIEHPPAGWSRRRCCEYFDWSAAVVAGCRGANARLERRFDEVLARGRAEYTERR
jgi:guanosine-3',5'-bis(diphosphate) 3'-pyrophosphohydrolase